MAHILDWLPTNPAQCAPPKLGDHTMIHIPCLKVHSAPYTAFFTPQGPQTLKHQPTGTQIWIRSFELAIILVDHLLTVSISDHPARKAVIKRKRTDL
jgi:hypothetical protein